MERYKKKNEPFKISRTIGSVSDRRFKESWVTVPEATVLALVTFSVAAAEAMLLVVRGVGYVGGGIVRAAFNNRKRR